MNKKEQPISCIALKLVFWYWLFLVIVALSSCRGPKERRGDWMEHLNEKQFTSEPLMVHWDRRNYHSMEELREMWKTTYEKAIADLDKEQE